MQKTNKLLTFSINYYFLKKEGEKRNEKLKSY